ncbi:chromatin assembly factor 1 subunit B-like [Anneissia japonica]|uniref:chromatin assembly factor 1 subunit B-like n=1 Tax=Anneissia japonica TaxID=1529436 RepID=UPI0014258364|nr:chromatin assembly factor 1 subunit B-like [Anneissia japonica]
MKLDTPEISWHGRDPVYSVDIQKIGKNTRLATAGADNKIRIWYLTVDSDGKPWVQFASNLSRHTKAVNVVRFSTSQHVLASAGDESVIYLWKLQEGQVGSSFMDKEEEIENKENWTVHKMLRGHLEDVYDLCWSKDCNQLISGSVDNSAIVWDVVKGEKLHLLKDHKNYVQGVAFDPQNQFVATFSCDRSCRIYSLQSRRCVNHVTRMSVNTTNNEG